MSSVFYIELETLWLMLICNLKQLSAVSRELLDHPSYNSFLVDELDVDNNSMTELLTQLSEKTKTTKKSTF